uniref:Protein LATERAL ROOT PRIMORDIUM 1 n=1 Tax=Anthurium amnicola TaxID=1678845 RepID=A0A1D1Z4Z9_9ARAE
MAPLNYGLADVGMIGLRDVLLVAPAASFHPTDAPAALDHPVIPLLAAAPCLLDDPDAPRARLPPGINLWQNPPPAPRAVLDAHNSIAPAPSSSYFARPMPFFDPTSNPAGISQGGGGAQQLGMGGFGVPPGLAAASSSSSATCQDCGNQAKKDCSHRRCRTCCKSRGLHCATHVKSTWVSAARRRERQASATGPCAATSSASTSGATKKPRLAASDAALQAAATNTTASRASTSNTTTTPPRSLDTGSSHQDAGFREGYWPGQVRAPAVFKCVRVTTVEDGEDEYAYQAVVSIGGHLFKGFLYDQGVEEAGSSGVHGGGLDDGTRNSSGSMPNISDLHLGGGSAAVGGGGTALDGGGGLMMGGTAFGNPLN